MAEVSTLQTLARMEAYLLAIPFWLTLVLGALALVLTLSGLFSVLSYLVEQRTREIGVRMAIGATRRNIAALVVSQLVSAGRPRPAPRGQPHGRARRRAPGDARGGRDRDGGAALRPDRLRGEPVLRRHGLHRCGADSRAARRADRPGRRPQAGLRGDAVSTCRRVIRAAGPSADRPRRPPGRPVAGHQCRGQQNRGGQRDRAGIVRLRLEQKRLDETRRREGRRIL